MYEAEITEIEDAFSDVPYPGDENIIYCGYIPHCDECMENAAAFRGKHWKDLAISWLRSRVGAICHFTKDSFRFYLPGYMIAILRDPHSDAFTADEMVYTMGYVADEPEAGDSGSAMNFTAAQLRAIVTFLKTMKKERPLSSLDWDKAITYYEKSLAARNQEK